MKLVALDALTFFWVVAIDVHIAKTRFWRNVLFPVFIEPVGFSKLAVQTASGQSKSLQSCTAVINAQKTIIHCSNGVFS